jgi:hypothetical protein
MKKKEPPSYEELASLYRTKKWGYRFLFTLYMTSQLLSWHADRARERTARKEAAARVRQENALNDTRAEAAALRAPVRRLLNAFPRVETELKKNGLDPKLAAAYTPGREVRVLTDSPEGKAAALALLGPAIKKKQTDPNIAGFTQYSLSEAFPSVCVIYYKKNEPSRHVQPANLKRELNYILMHEEGHCTPENSILPSGPVQEGHASFISLESVFFDRTLMQQEIYRQAAQTPYDADHDTVLYLDARFRNVEPPSSEEILRANKEAWDIITTGMTGEDAASPNARRRIELYRKGMELEGIHLGKLTPMVPHVIR